jgi:hypothetical protein
MGTVGSSRGAFSDIFRNSDLTTLGILATVIICAFVKRPRLKQTQTVFAEKRFAKPFYGGF